MAIRKEVIPEILYWILLGLIFIGILAGCRSGADLVKRGIEKDPSLLKDSVVTYQDSIVIPKKEASFEFPTPSVGTPVFIVDEKTKIIVRYVADTTGNSQIDVTVPEDTAVHNGSVVVPVIDGDIVSKEGMTFWEKLNMFLDRIYELILVILFVYILTLVVKWFRRN